MKNFENQSIFDEVKAYKNGALFAHPVGVGDLLVWSFIDTLNHTKNI